MRFPILAAGLLATSAAYAEDAPVLTVYTYDSFVSDWGPGPAIEEAFEATCACDLQFVAAGDGAALLARLKLEGARSDADIVLGLDTNLMAAASLSSLCLKLTNCTFSKCVGPSEFISAPVRIEPRDLGRGKERSSSPLGLPGNSGFLLDCGSGLKTPAILTNVW